MSQPSVSKRCDFCRQVVPNLKKHQKDCPEYVAWALAPEKYWREYWEINGTSQLTIRQVYGAPIVKYPGRIATNENSWGALLNRSVFMTIEDARNEIRKRLALKIKKLLAIDVETLPVILLPPRALDYYLEKRPLLTFGDNNESLP